MREGERKEKEINCPFGLMTKIGHFKKVGISMVGEEVLRKKWGTYSSKEE